MYARSCFMLLGVFLLSMLTGCPNPWAANGSLFLVDASKDRAVVEYDRQWDGMETGPSSLWLVDLNGGDATRFKAARKQFVQAGGDYYVAELVGDHDVLQSVVAGQFSTADEWKLFEPDAESESYGGVLLDGSRAVYCTPDGLAIYGLPERAIRKTVPVSEAVAFLDAVGGKYALTCLESGEALVNLDDGSVSALPAAPNDFTPEYLGAVLSDNALITSAAIFGQNEISQAILILDLPGQTWRVLADYGRTSGILVSGGVGVYGADDNFVLVSRIEQFWKESYELVDRATGERTIVATNLPVVPSIPLLRDGRVFWIDQTASVIRSFDSATHETRAYSLNIRD
jgi:hypothetical protein